MLIYWIAAYRTLVHVELAVASETRVKILRTLLQEALPQLDIPALAREAGKSQTGTRKALKGLLSSGTVVSQQRGRTTYYSANGDHPWFPHLLHLFRQERDRHNVPHLFPTFWNHLETIVSDLVKTDDTKIVILHGSLTRAPVYPDADVDLLIGTRDPGPPPTTEQTILGHPVSILTMTTEQLEHKAKKNDPFVMSVLERHVLLYRSHDYRPPWLAQIPSTTH